MKVDRTSSYLPSTKIRKGEQKMFLKYVLLGMLLETLLIILIVLLVKTKKNCKKYKELQAKKKRQEAFRKKMKELEIK